MQHVSQDKDISARSNYRHLQPTSRSPRPSLAICTTTLWHTDAVAIIAVTTGTFDISQRFSQGRGLLVQEKKMGSEGQGNNMHKEKL